MADSRRSGDEIHPWLLNDDLRPFMVSRDRITERPLRKQMRSFSSSYLTGTIDHLQTFFVVRNTVY